MFFIVRFTRPVLEDLDCARENFGHLEFNPTLQLLEQFKMELYANKRLRGLWTTLPHYDSQDGEGGTLYVWVAFLWPDGSTMEAFVAELQRTYDEEGMSGSFQIVDGVNAEGESLFGAGVAHVPNDGGN
jgi:hypothetical protein